MEPERTSPIETIGSRTVYSNRWLTLREDRIRRLDGVEGVYSVVEKPPFALVIPWDGEHLHLVGQWRYPVGRFCWEFPQGSLQDDPERAIEEVAAIELAEETGLRAGRLERLGELYAAYGYSSQTFVAFLATELTEGEANPEAEEQDIESRRVTVPEFVDMLRTGAMPDAHSAAAFALWRISG